MLHHVPYSEEIRLRELRAKRKTLWRRFEENPEETHLAAKLKVIDDLIAQPDLQIGQEDNEIDDSEKKSDPEVGGLFLLLAVFQRRGSQPDLVQPRSRDSATERSSQGPPTLDAHISNGKMITMAQTAKLPPHCNAEESFQELNSRKIAPVFLEAGILRRSRNQQGARCIDRKSLPQDCRMITQRHEG